MFTRWSLLELTTTEWMDAGVAVSAVEPLKAVSQSMAELPCSAPRSSEWSPPGVLRPAFRSATSCEGGGPRSRPLARRGRAARLTTRPRRHCRPKGMVAA